jgi:hypothetical protein
MEAVSAMTRAADPYRAGLELAQTLSGIDPEVVFLTTTIDYGNSPEILEGLCDGVGNDELIIIGSSGDGCYGAEGVGVHGASAMALNSGGTVRWRVFYGQGIAAGPEGITRQVLDEATSRERPAFLYIVSDFRTDATRIERVLSEYPDTPITGGLAADDDRLQESVLYANGQVVTDGVAVLAAYGPMEVWTRVANDMTPVGPWGTVEDADETVVRRIDGMDATAFIEHAIGKPVLRSDRAVICLRLEDPDEPSRHRIRSVVPDFAGPEEHVGLFGGIRPGERVQVCVPEVSELLAGIERLAVQARDDGITPAAALMVSCAGRKWFLGQKVQQEIASVTDTLTSSLPMTGFASFGEIGPRTGIRAPYNNAFHNMSLVLTLIGS